MLKNPNIKKCLIFVLILGIFSFISLWAYFNNVTICIFKRIFGIPCPGCGITRGIMSILLHGDIAAALYVNPLSVVILVLFAAAAVWFIVDLLRGTSTLKKFIIRPLPYWTIPIAAVLTAANWIWNIVKGI